MRLFLISFSLFFLLLGLSVRADVPKSSWSQQVEEIDRELKRLSDLKNRYKASADRHEDTAQRLQFDSQFTLDARYEMRLAEKAREKEAELQEQIDELKEKRDQILKSHPEAKSP